MSCKKSATEPPVESVIPFSPCSNGEYVPGPVTERARRAEELWRRIVEDNHRRLGLTRREFARSACGIAASLLALDHVACGGDATGAQAGGSSGFYDVDAGMTEDMECAQEVLYDPDAFVFDVQTHVQTPLEEAWPETDPPDIALDYLKQVFVAGGTTVACISGTPATRDPGEGNVRARAQLREILDRIGGDRLRLHCNIDMRRVGEVDYMQTVAESFDVSAWKVYPYQQQWLNTPERGVPFIDKARSLGIGVIAAHRGISQNGDYLSAGSPRDLVEAASLHPDMLFLAYHSGWERDSDENHPYDPMVDPAELRGVDRFVRAMEEFSLPANGSNVYAELGSTWHNLRSSPEQAAHALGKLLRFVGEDRVIYGTDSVFTGTPEGQIAALRAFQIPEPLREMYGYPEITPELRRKILGLNAAPIYGVDPMEVRCAFGNDEIEGMRMAYLDDPRSVDMPHPDKYLGPKTRRDFFAFLRAERRDHELG